jgi:glycosyltransferase involved in cell wall biosynthesis
MNVVIADGDVSYPPTSGKRLRTLNLMQRLASRHRITYIARGRGDTREAEQATAFLGQRGIESLIVDDPLPRKSGPAFYARLAANLFSAVPYNAATHASPRMRQAVQAYAATHVVDLWQFEWTPYLGALSHHPDAPKVLNAHNVDSLIWQRYFETEENLIKRWYVKQQWRRFERYERRIFAEATHVVAVSDEDAALVRKQFGCPCVDVVENGIDRAFFEQARGTRDPHRILFLGALDWRPNLDAIELLLNRIFHAVRVTEKRATLQIVGRNPPSWLRDRVAGAAGVELHANVVDVRPYLAASGVLAVPLRIGGGSRLKILEALACGLPVVSTRLGAEGLRLDGGKHLTVVPDQDSFSAALLDTLAHPERAAAMAQEARRRVLAEYDWDALADKLEQVWEKCVECRRPARALAIRDRFARCSG